jgi:hypothetical protein
VPGAARTITVTPSGVTSTKVQLSGALPGMAGGPSSDRRRGRATRTTCQTGVPLRSRDQLLTFGCRRNQLDSSNRFDQFAFGSSDINDPELSNLHGEQRHTGSGGTLTLTATVVDLDGNIFGGQCTIETPLGTVTSQISDLGSGTARDSVVGTVSCSTPYSGHGVTASENLYVVDRDGNRSNRLSFTFVTEQSASTIL